MFELLTGLGLALPAGLNAYIPLLAIAIADRYFGLIHLNSPYDVIASPGGIALIVVLLLIELLADKIPVVDHVNDLINTVIRPAAGATLMMASTDAVSYINPVVAMFLGLIVAGSVHTVKAGIRPVVTASTGGVGNPIVSAGEDGLAIGISVIALVAPLLILVVLAGQTVLIVYLLRERRRHRLERQRSQLPP
jgi:hypothetical protein